MTVRLCAVLILSSYFTFAFYLDLYRGLINEITCCFLLIILLESEPKKFLSQDVYDFQMTDVSEQVKKFVFHSKSGEDPGESLEIFIPELLQASYSFYTWPSAPVLAWFLWEHRRELPGKNVVELGAGTALPGILAAKCGAVVTLTDSASLPKSLQHIRRCCEVNGLTEVRVLGITWGLFLSNIFSIGPVDLILGSDLFYEPNIFEDILVTVAFLLEKNPQAHFLCVYQERSADWSIAHLLNKWNLRCVDIPIDNLGAESGISVTDLVQDHTIHLLEITRA